MPNPTSTPSTSATPPEPRAEQGKEKPSAGAKAKPKAKPGTPPAGKPAARKADAGKTGSDRKSKPRAQDTAPAAAPAAPKVTAAKHAAKGKARLVRDSFTMPEADYAHIAVLKDRALGFRRPTKKSELLRAGLQLLAGLSPTELQKVLGGLEPLKTGRPRKEG
jgi:hypothetical protein